VNQVPGADGILTGKFFEDLGAGKPVLAVGEPGSDLARIIAETNCGFCAGFTEKEKMKEAIRKVFEKFPGGKQPAGNIHRKTGYRSVGIAAER
jgi:hypothetical protein